MNALPPKDLSSCRLKLMLYGERKFLATLNAPQGLAAGQGLAPVGVGMICFPLTRTFSPTVAVMTGLEPPGLPSRPFGALLPGRLSRKGLAFGISKKSPTPPRSKVSFEKPGE